VNSPSASPSPVAVVDIGSNSIKLLVAARAADGSLHELTQHTKETRIGAGITGKPPRLGEEAMTNAVAAVQELLGLAALFKPAQVRVVATSAVRDAANRADFTARVQTATGHAVRVLSGDEEAHLIGRGIACEAALRSETAFYLFDLGGGSLEMLKLIGGRVVRAQSLQLGCVRVTEACVADPARPLAPGDIEKVRAHVRAIVAASGFAFDLPAPSPAVVTGGTATTVRAMRAATWGRALEVESPVLAIAELDRLAARVSAMPLDERRRVPGLPATRADVFPAALYTLIELAQLAAVDALRHSVYNLRYGLAAEALGL
jgi:exopolyphosphatase / guanosine-5'-triphosphate,3'-diphosphate pyrophosphatase